MKSVFVKRLIFSQNSKAELINRLGLADFSSSSGEGVHILDNSENCISCHFLFEKVYSQSTYNIATEEFEQIEFKRVECIPFFVDLEQETLDIIGNKAQAARVIEFFGKITKYQVGIEDVQINLLKLLQNCSLNGILFNISKVKIAEYSFFDNIVGDCSLNLFGYPKALDIVKKYEHQITNVTISISMEDTYSVAFYRSGAVAIYKDADSIDIEIIRLLKQGL